MSGFSHYGPRALSLGLAATLASPLIFPGTLNPAAATLFGAGLGAALCAMALLVPRPLARTEIFTIAAAFALIGWLTFRSLAATNPVVSFLGTFGHHQGTALWVLGVVWFVAGVLLADRRALRDITITIAAAGGIYSLWAVFELLTRAGGRVQGAPAGVFEVSSSLGVFLALSLLASVATGAISRSPRLRMVGGLLAALSVIGILVEESRTAWLGFAAALGVALLLWFIRSRAQAHAVASALPAGGILISAGLLAASTGVLGEQVLRLVANIGTDRDVIWRAVLEHSGHARLAGSGLEEFSAWIAWEVAGGELSRASLTFDPHNVAAAILLGGGVVGLTLLLIALTLLMRSCVGVFLTQPGSLSFTLALMAPVALGAAGLVGWIPADAVIAGAVLTGAAIGAATKRVSRQALAGDAGSGDALLPPRIIASISLVAAVLTTVIAVAAFPTERTFARASSEPGPDSSPQALAALYEQWPDPAIAVLTLDRLWGQVVAGDQRAQLLAEEVMERSAGDLVWRANLGLLHIDTRRALQTDTAELLDEYLRTVESARRADPGSGVWYTLAALEAQRLGLTDEAQRLGAMALELDLPKQARIDMEALTN